MSKRKIPELEFYRDGDLHYALVTYKKERTRVLLDEESLRDSREYLIQVCIDMDVSVEYIAAWQERVYRWYLDQGNPKVR